MIERTAYMFDDDENFLQVRLVDPKTKCRDKKAPRKIDGDNTLRFDDRPPKAQKGLELTRHAE